MDKKNGLTKTLAMLGTILVWFPILAPFVFFAIRSVQRRQIMLNHIDYLMPAELFPAVLIGGGLLLWAALRVHSQHRLVGVALGVAVGVLIAGQALAVVTGLASGATEPTGLPWALVVGSLAVYILAVVVMGVGGIRLLRDLYGP